jgi:hypothetical protein
MMRTPADPVHPGAPPWPRLPVSFVVAAAMLVVAAAIAGWAARSVTAPVASAPAAPARAIEVGPVNVTVPGSWASEPVSSARVTGLEPGSAAFAPVPGLNARAVVLVAPFTDPTLLPASLRPLAELSGRPRKAALAGLPAWTYPQKTLAGGGVAQVTVAPTTAGSLAVACIAPMTAWSGVERCAEDLASASLRGATPLVPSATLAFRLLLPPVIGRLGDRRAALRSRLRGATTRRGQARLAGRLGRAHGRAAAALAPSAPAAGAPRRVVRLLRANARSYGRFSVAARRVRPVRYRRARAAIRRTDRALARTVARVR